MNSDPVRRSDLEIFHDLMRYKVREVLLVSTRYDAFILEEEGKISERIFDTYYQLNLTNAPYITNVSSGERALGKLRTHKYDLVVLMMGLEDMNPFDLSLKIRTINSKIPILLLLKDNSEVAAVRDRPDLNGRFDNIFVWNGDSQMFLAMIKYIEDTINVSRDTRIGLVRVILLVEDSIQYYSRYLPTLYAEIIKQTQKLMTDEKLDERRRLLRMRARPKVLLARSYNDAIDLIRAYREYLLCVISDVQYPKDGVLDDDAGIHLIRHVRDVVDVPVVLQSSETVNRDRALQLGAAFIDKNSNSLARDLQDFIFNYLGFGDFVFTDAAGARHGSAGSLDEIARILPSIPIDSVLFHAHRNHFSAWLMARGEIQIAKKLKPIQISDFKSPEELRTYLISIFQTVHLDQIRGRIIEFDETLVGNDHYILRLAEGSLGGKGRGIAFVNRLLQESASTGGFAKNVSVRIPLTAIVGTAEFDRFIERNGLADCYWLDEEQVMRRFDTATLSPELETRLASWLDRIRVPLAVRPSGLFEDSISQPFSGMYPTYLLPNNEPDPAVRLDRMFRAIKWIFASVFSRQARQYFESLNYKIEQEKMAVVIQTLIGRAHDDRFYPDFSGVAQSHNFYPFSYLRPADGLAVCAVGLSRYIAEGQKAFRFCPRYPKLDFLTTEDKLRDLQSWFYALDLRNASLDYSKGENATLVSPDLTDAERDGVLASIASTWDEGNGRIEPGIYISGPRVVDFAPILKYDAFPLASTLETLLDSIHAGLNSPLEMRFAVNMDERDEGRPVLYVLQINRLIREAEACTVDLEESSRESVLIHTRRSMGNGRICDLTDILFVVPDRFDNTCTEEMAVEIEAFNQRMRSVNRKYLLIGPGRWGTRDRFLGIPVIWPQISNARIIVEVGLEDFQVDASFGSHFFHNITSMNIGYFSVPFGTDSAGIDWNWLRGQPVESAGRFISHVRLTRPLSIIMDGRTGHSIIFKGD